MPLSDLVSSSPAVPVLVGGAVWLASLAGAVVVVHRAYRRHRAAPPDAGQADGPRMVENLIVAITALVIAGIAFVISFESVSTMAHSWAECAVPQGSSVEVCMGPQVWQRWPWALPIAVDLSIVGFDYLDLWLIRRSQELSWLRFVPRLAVVGTIVLNVISAHEWGDRFAHALLLFNYAVLAHVLRHAIETKRTGGRVARVDMWQWTLAPRAAYRTWRIMRLEKLSWEAATAASKQRALIRFWLVEHYRAEYTATGKLLTRVPVRFRAVTTRGWSYVPAELQARFRMGEYAALGKVAGDIAARVAVVPVGVGNGVAGSDSNPVAGRVADGVSGSGPAVSADSNPSGFGAEVLLLGRPSGVEWVAAAERLAVAEAGNPEGVARARQVAAAVAELIEADGKLPSNAQVGKRLNISHTSAGNYKRKLREYFEVPVGESEAVGEG